MDAAAHRGFPEPEPYGTFPGPATSAKPGGRPPTRPDVLYRHWVLLSVGLLFLLGLLTQALWRPRPPLVPPVEPEAPATFTYTEAAVYVSRNLRWQEVSYGGCDEAAASACAMYNDSLAVTGWGQLWIRALPRGNTYAAYRTAMFAAGYAEGALTHRRIWEHYQNTYAAVFDGEPEAPQRVREFLAENLAWVRRQVARYTPPTAHSEDDEEDVRYWQTVGGVMAQFDGLVAGYHDFHAPGSRLSELDLFLLNADGDLIDLVPALTGAPRRRVHALRSHLSYQEAVKSLRCSAVIRVVPDQSDVLWGHATWDLYSSMNRIYKFYDVPLPSLLRGERGAALPRRRVALSSSPGFLGSVDDWYLMDNRLAVLETTNGLYRDALYTLISPLSVMSWVRVSVANILATNGPQWTQLFSRFNSGTYNNQWMVLDLNRFRPGEGFRKGGLMVLEQIPGRVEVADVTPTLNRQGYWASYNIPSFEVIYELSGFRDEFLAGGKDSSWSHQDCPRARIFARDAPKVRTLADLKQLMRANDWRTDPLCDGHPSNAVAARYDLESDLHLQSLEGAIDAKVTSYRMAANLECEAVNGPTSQRNPPFDWRWAAPTPSVLHLGMPPRFNFSFVPMQPRSFRRPKKERRGEVYQPAAAE